MTLEVSSNPFALTLTDSVTAGSDYLGAVWEVYSNSGSFNTPKTYLPCCVIPKTAIYDCIVSSHPPGKIGRIRPQTCFFKDSLDLYDLCCYTCEGAIPFKLTKLLTDVCIVLGPISQVYA